MRSAIALGALLVVTGCPGGGLGGGDDIAAAAELYGWWTSDDFIQAFAAPETAHLDLPVHRSETEGPLMVTYERVGAPSWGQTSYYRVEGDSLVTEPLRDAYELLDEDAELSNRILELVPGERLSLETFDGAQRDYSFADRCPRPLSDSGYETFPLVGCGSYLVGGGAMAFDDDGRLHVIQGMQGVEDAATCEIGPRYTRVGFGCESVSVPFPALRSSALVFHEGALYAAYTQQAAFSVLEDHELFFRTLPTLDGRWQEEVIGGKYSGRLRLTMRADGPSLLAHTFDQEVYEIRRADDGGWTRTLQLDDAGAPLPALSAASAAPDGAWWALTETPFRLWRQTDVGWTATDIPDAPAAGFDVDLVVDDEGRAHVVWTGDLISQLPGGGGTVVGATGYYGVYDGAEWTVHAVGPFTYPKLAGPGVVMHGMTKQQRPTMFLTDIDVDTGVVSTELAIPGVGIEGSGSPEFFWTPMALARGSEVALTFIGAQLAYRPGRDRPRLDVDVTIELGAGVTRVFTDNGAADCATTCTLTLPRHEVLHLRAEGDGELTASGCAVTNAFETALECPLVVDEGARATFTLR